MNTPIKYIYIDELTYKKKIPFDDQKTYELNTLMALLFFLTNEFTLSILIRGPCLMKDRQVFMNVNSSGGKKKAGVEKPMKLIPVYSIDEKKTSTLK